MSSSIKLTEKNKTQVIEWLHEKGYKGTITPTQDGLRLGDALIIDHGLRLYTMRNGADWYKESVELCTSPAHATGIMIACD